MLMVENCNSKQNGRFRNVPIGNVENVCYYRPNTIHSAEQRKCNVVTLFWYNL
jgi:hypothetical protein